MNLRSRSEKSKLQWFRFPELCSLPAVCSAPSLQPLVKATRTGACMPLGSPAQIIPFKRFLECRQRLNRLPVANGTLVMSRRPVGIQLGVTGTGTVTMPRRQMYQRPSTR